MDASREIVIDGHRVICKITRQGEDGYAVVIATTRADEQGMPPPLSWRAAATRNFATREDAERHARYVLLGVCSVSQNGDPVLSVT